MDLVRYGTVYDRGIPLFSKIARKALRSTRRTKKDTR